MRSNIYSRIKPSPEPWIPSNRLGLIWTVPPNSFSWSSCFQQATKTPNALVQKHFNVRSKRKICRKTHYYSIQLNPGEHGTKIIIWTNGTTSDMPSPVSWTSIFTLCSLSWAPPSPPATRSKVVALPLLFIFTFDLVTETVTVPPAWEYLNAFPSRLPSTWQMRRLSICKQVSSNMRSNASGGGERTRDTPDCLDWWRNRWETNNTRSDQMRSDQMGWDERTTQRVRWRNNKLVFGYVSSLTCK